MIDAQSQIRALPELVSSLLYCLTRQVGWGHAYWHPLSEDSCIDLCRKSTEELRSQILICLRVLRCETRTTPPSGCVTLVSDRTRLMMCISA